ncbi:MAG: cytochrome c maturation protein CcmE [Nitrospiria bacterium]
MTRVYIRWAVLSLLFGTIGILGFVRYNRDVRTISPKALLESPAGAHIRLLGMVEPGSLIENAAEGTVHFDISGEGRKIAVKFSGSDEEILRELKTIVVVGQWHRETGELVAQEIALNPNYGFITSAYLLSLIPLAFFIFHMERKVALLYIMIKEERAYQPEAGL